MKLVLGVTISMGVIFGAVWHFYRRAKNYIKKFSDHIYQVIPDKLDNCIQDMNDISVKLRNHVNKDEDFQNRLSGQFDDHKRKLGTIEVGLAKIDGKVQTLIDISRNGSKPHD